jgi:hypothetical protein
MGKYWHLYRECLDRNRLYLALDEGPLSKKCPKVRIPVWLERPVSRILRRFDQGV